MNLTQTKPQSSIPKKETPLDFTLVIPAYKDAPHIVENASILARYFQASDLHVEFIFVEDASPDNTLAEVKRAVDAVQQYGILASFIPHLHNQGRGAAVRSGIEKAKGSCVGFIDIDLEHEYQPLLAAIERVRTHELDVVIGQRHSTNPWTKPIRWILSYGYRFLLRIVMPLPVRDTEAGFKIFHREKILPVLRKTKNPSWFWDTEIVHRSFQAGLRVGGISIGFTQNPNKESTVSAVKDSLVYFKTLLIYLWNLKHESH